jgi:hypothetical protein
VNRASMSPTFGNGGSGERGREPSLTLGARPEPPIVANLATRFARFHSSETGGTLGTGARATFPGWRLSRRIPRPASPLWPRSAFFNRYRSGCPYGLSSFVTKPGPLIGEPGQYEPLRSERRPGRGGVASPSFSLGAAARAAHRFVCEMRGVPLQAGRRLSRRKLRLRGTPLLSYRPGPLDPYRLARRAGRPASHSPLSTRASPSGTRGVRPPARTVTRSLAAGNSEVSASNGSPSRAAMRGRSLEPPKLDTPLPPGPCNQ